MQHVRFHREALKSADIDSKYQLSSPKIGDTPICSHHYIGFEVYQELTDA